jgi:adenylate cyclase
MTFLRAWANKGRLTKLRCVLAVTLLLASIGGLNPSCMSRIEDMGTRAASMMPFNHGPSRELTIVAIDSSSIKEIGEWPWNKKNCLKLLGAIKEAGATAALIPSEMTRVIGRKLQSKAGLPIVAEYDFTMTVDKKQQPKEKLLKIIAFPSAPENNGDILKMLGIELAHVGRASPRSLSYGFSNIFPDMDGVVRRQPLAVSFDGMAFPSSEITATAQVKDFTPTIKQDPSGNPTGISIGDIRIPTQGNASIIINFRRGSHTFDHISAAELVSLKTDKKVLEGRIALIGVTATPTSSWFKTPLGRMPHVEIEANTLENIIDSRWITALTGRIFSPIFILALGALFFLITRGSDTITQLRMSGAILIGIWTVGLSLEAYASIRVPIIFMTIALALFQGTIFTWHLLMNVVPRSILRKHFSGKLNQTAANAIADNPELVEMQTGGRTATALALDIRGFSRLSAKLPPEKLATFLREYRSAISEILLKEDALIESWVGDECRAFFGIPILFPNHTRRACKSALLIKKAISAKRRTWKDHYGLENIRIGIGIHSGSVHFEAQSTARGPDLTVTGSTVEIAARLRTLSRIYGTSILTSDAIEETTCGSFAFRPLDTMSLGADSRTVIHELMGNLGLILPQMDDFLEARSAYIVGDFDRASKLFTSILDEYPNDGPSLMMKKRALEHLVQK